MTQAAIQPQWRRGMPVLNFRMAPPNVVKLKRKADRVNVIPTPQRAPVRKENRAATKRQARAEIRTELAGEPDVDMAIPPHIRSAIADAASVISLKAPAEPLPTVLQNRWQDPVALQTRNVGQPTGNPGKFDALAIVTIAVAVVLAGISGYFSITGMAAIFPGANLSIGGWTLNMAAVMDGAMEAGKLAGAAWLSRRWLDLGPVRYPLSGLILVVAVINAVGVFGQLSAAHLNPHVQAVAVTDETAAANTQRLEIQENMIKSLNRQIAQIDTAIEEATKRGRTASALTMMSEQRQNRGELVTERLKAEGSLIALRTQAAAISGQQKRAAADIGVLQYAADTFRMDRETMIELLILAMVLSCDPFSIALIVATSRRRK